MLTAPTAMILSGLMALAGQYAQPSDEMQAEARAAKPLRFSGTPQRTYVVRQADSAKTLSPGDNPLIAARKVNCTSNAGCGILVTSSLQLSCRSPVGEVATTYQVDSDPESVGPGTPGASPGALMGRHDFLPVSQGSHLVTFGIQITGGRKFQCSAGAIEADVTVLEH